MYYSCQFRLCLVATVVLLHVQLGRGQQVFLSDNFENGLGQWVCSGLDWDTTSAASRGAVHCITDSPHGDYPANANEVIETAAFLNLSGSYFPVLSFWHKYSIHDGSNYCYNTDYALVQVSTDGGFGWTTVRTYTAWQASWTQEIVDLRGFRRNQVKVRFCLTSGYQCQDDGWYIDDLQIKELVAGSPVALPFEDGFENGLVNWTSSGRDWDSISTSSCRGRHCIVESPTGNYLPYANSSISLSGSIDLTSTTFPVLTFWHKYSIHDGSNYCYNTDYALVEISRDAGFAWTTLKTYSGWQSTWSQEMIDLRGFRADSIKVRFRFTSGYQCQVDGWYIDDVQITEFDPGPNLNLPFTDSFESGLGNWKVSGRDWDTCSSTFRSPQHCITESRIGNYLSYTNSCATTLGKFNLTSATTPVLSFWHKYTIHDGSNYCYNTDYAQVEISTNGGWTWICDTSFTGTVSTWYQVQRRLSSYRSDSVKIRFRLSSGYQCELDGWYVDDVSVRDITVSVDESSIRIPTSFDIHQNYPNPFNPSTTINYQLPTTSEVTLKVFDLLGREVVTLVDEIQDSGFKSVEFDASGLASGVYLYRLKAFDPSLHSGHGFVETKKLLLLR